MDEKKLGKILLDVKKAFPELRHRKIRLKRCYFSFIIYTMNANPLFNIILYNRRFVRTLGTNAVKGAIAHELCHLVQEKRGNIFDLVLRALKYTISKDFMSRVEKQTDTCAIKRGFGKELYEARKGIEKVLPKNVLMKRKGIYYSASDIKKMI